MSSQARSLSPAPRWMLFFAIAVAGLFYVKWQPYWGRAFVAASHHSIGQSILMGKGDMLVIPRGTLHKRSTEDSVTFILISTPGVVKA